MIKGDCTHINKELFLNDIYLIEMKETTSDSLK